jgi:hypothetical protein
MHPADSSLATLAPAEAPWRAQHNAIRQHFELLSARQRALGSTIAALLLGMWLTFSVTSLANTHTADSAHPPAPTGTVTGILLGRVLPVVAGVALGGLLGWHRCLRERSQS